MRKIFAGMFATMAAIVLCVCFSACTTTFTGTWKISSMYVNVGGVEQTIEVEIGRASCRERVLAGV